MLDTVLQRLAQFPGVVLVGPRQVGKTTLAHAIAALHPDAVFLDLERPEDRAQLESPGVFFKRNRSRLVVLDEVQFVPQIFSQLRPEIDAERRPGRFLLLGSASGALLRQSAESLAGRVAYLELTPLLLSEMAVPAEPDASLAAIQVLWSRGGFPLSFTAASDAASWMWRTSLITNFVQRDLKLLGVNVPSPALHRFWRMAAHLHGQVFNASQIGKSLGDVAHTTVARYLDTFVDSMMLRRLEPFFVNVGKRLVKSPKVYVRDSGLLHALLGLPDVDALIGHPGIGHSWEGFVIEQICAQLEFGELVSFYRTAAGAELDLVVETGSRRIGFEIKFSAAPKVTKGFWQACEDVGVHRAYVVAPVRNGWPLAENVEVVSPLSLRGGPAAWG